MAIKRLREEDETVATANCLMLLSKVGKSETEEGSVKFDHRRRSGAERVFECKTCKKKFHSFQALGGHRASHKKLKIIAADLLQQAFSPPSPAKPKSHTCSICGLEFPMGQALGGHMRRHRQFDRSEEEKSVAAVAVEVEEKSVAKAVPILTRSVSSKRIFGFDGLDLNLTPDENDLKLSETSSPLHDFFM